MRKLALMALSIGAIGLYGCGGGGDGDVCNNDGICDSADGENSTNCPADCEVVFADASVTIDAPPGVCNNDDTCDPGEDFANCPNDCPELVCNPATDIGCGPSEKCGVIIQSPDPNFLTTTDCVDAGDVALGSACAYDGDVANGGTGASDCVGGTECNGGICVKVCDGDAVPGDCPTDEVCQMYNGFYSASSFGWCEPTCDPVGDDGFGVQETGCGGTDGCYVNIFNMGSICGNAYCDGDNLCGHDDSCQYINACHPGKSCASLNEAQDELLCTKICIPPVRAMGLTEQDLPLVGESADNGQAPWNCGRLNDGNGQPDDALLYAKYVCIPLGGDDVIKYWGDLTAADGWPYASGVGICIDTESAEWGGNPYEFNPNAFTGQTRWKPRMGSKSYMQKLKRHPDYKKIIKYLDAKK